MNEIATKQASKDLLTAETKESKLAELALQERITDVVWAVLTLVSANKMNREEADSFLQDWITNDREANYTYGIMRGYAIAKGLVKLKKRKQNRKAKAKIMRVLMKNPEATNKEIARALDNAEIPLYKSRSRPKDKRLWSDVVKLQNCKNLISRERKQVARAKRIRNWDEWLSDITCGWGHGATDFLDIDPPLY